MLVCKSKERTYCQRSLSKVQIPPSNTLSTFFPESVHMYNYIIISLSKSCSIHSIISNSSFLICHQWNVCIYHMDRSRHCHIDCSSLVLNTVSNNMPWMSYERNTGTHEGHNELPTPSQNFPAQATGISNIFLSSSIYVTCTHSQSYLHSVKYFTLQWKLTH